MTEIDIRTYICTMYIYEMENIRDEQGGHISMRQPVVIHVRLHIGFMRLLNLTLVVARCTSDLNISQTFVHLNSGHFI